MASFSGGCVVDRDPQAIAVSATIIQYTTAVLADPNAIFGPRATQELNWQAHDPGTLVGNVRGMQIALWTGDGTRGKLDPDPIDPGAAGIDGRLQIDVPLGAGTTPDTVRVVSRAPGRVSSSYGR